MPRQNHAAVIQWEGASNSKKPIDAQYFWFEKKTAYFAKKGRSGRRAS